ncbi:MAG TPA: GtrA family protein [Candidatus Fimivivens faecavium]|nr:GtrA family protein [Candidatus Fimivivens faecavium]
MKKLLDFYIKYREIFAYLVFGVLTTAVNIAGYAALTRIWRMEEMAATAAAWAISVAFAYFTNKLFVFESKSFAPGVILKEAASFALCRLFSGAVDLGIMWLFVIRLSYPDMVIKIGSNIIVIVMNYVLSKFLIFRRKPDDA